MNYTKPWMPIDEQVELLTSAKGLECDDLDGLRDALTSIGYYRLSAYWFPYKTAGESGSSVFRKGTTFDEVMRAYEFDRRLRLLMFEAIGRVEVFLRSRIAYFAAGEAGVFGYPDAIRDRLKREYSAAKKGEQYIKHFASKYGDEHDLPPYWMMVECATMGTIELLFSNVSPETRTEVAAELGVKVPVLKNWLSVFRVSRNACCHHSRVWNRTWGVRPVIPKSWEGFDASNDKTFAVLSVLYYALGKVCDAEPWRESLESLLDEFDDIELGKMGFPDDWHNGTPWSSPTDASHSI